MSAWLTNIVVHAAIGASFFVSIHAQADSFSEIKNKMERLYGEGVFSATEAISPPELERIFKSEKKRKTLKTLVIELQGVIGSEQKTNCSVNVSQHFLFLARIALDLYNLEHSSNFRAIAVQATENAVRCDPNSEEARSLLTDFDHEGE